jgi:hypothetical protein
VTTLTLDRPLTTTNTIPQENGWYTVTPEMSEEWEKTNHNPRNTSLTTVNQYARDMKNAHWEPNGEPLMFDEDGKLINGFHRTHACRVAQTPFRTYVIVGLPRGTKTFDLGYKRTHGQILKISGEHYGNFLAATARLLWKYQRGPRVLLARVERPTLQDVLDLLEEHPELRTSVELCAGSFHKAGRLCASSSIPSFIHYLGSRKHGHRATEFVEMIHKGIDPENQSNRPAYLLRERLLDWQQKRVKASQTEYLGLWIPAWNAYALKKKMRSLRAVDWSGEAPGSLIE